MSKNQPTRVDSSFSEDDDDEYDLVTFSFNSKNIQLEYFQLCKYSRTIANKYLLSDAKERLPDEITKFSQDNNIKEENVINFLNFFKDEELEITKDKYKDLSKLSKFLQVNKLLQQLKNYKKTYYESEIAALKESNTKLKESNSELEESNAKLKESNNELEKSNTKLKESNKKLKESNAKLKESNNELEKSNTKLKESNNELEESNTKLKESNKKLEESNAKLKESNNELEKSNTKLKESNKKLKESNAELKESNNELEESNAKLKKSNKKLEESNTKLKESNNELEKSNTKLKEENKNHQKQIDSLKQELLDMKNKMKLKEEEKIDNSFIESDEPKPKEEAKINESGDTSLKNQVLDNDFIESDESKPKEEAKENDSDDTPLEKKVLEVLQEQNNQQENVNPQGDQQQNNQQRDSHPRGRGQRGNRGGRGSIRGRLGTRSRPEGETQINESDGTELKNKMLEEYNDDYLEIMQDNEESPLHPLKPFDEIITGPKSGPILQVIDDLHFYQPSKIQSQAIPILNEQKKDLIAQAQIGSGKTVAYLISMLLHVDGEIHQPQTICLCHSRELIKQIFNVFTKLNKYTKFVGDICVKNTEDSEPPNKEAQLLFGTPASFTFWIKRGDMDVSKVNFLVIDEVDVFLDFDSTHYPPTANLMNKLLPPNVQYGFFSSTSTFKKEIIEFIQRKRHGIVTIRLRRNQQRVSTIDHWFTRVESKDEAYKVIFDLVSTVSRGQTFVFTRSKKIVPEITEYLISKGIYCKGFSTYLSNKDRDRTLQEFRDEEFKVLITSDVLSRGIDIPNTYLVINYQTPIQLIPIRRNNNRFVYQRDRNQRDKYAFPDCDTYYHRAGRAGRFGRSGLCFTIVTSEADQKNLENFCSSLNLNIPLNKIDKDMLKDLPEEKEVPVEGNEQEDAEDEQDDAEGGATA